MKSIELVKQNTLMFLPQLAPLKIWKPKKEIKKLKKLEYEMIWKLEKKL